MCTDCTHEDGPSTMYEIVQDRIAMPVSSGTNTLSGMILARESEREHEIEKGLSAPPRTMGNYCIDM